MEEHIAKARAQVRRDAERTSYTADELRAAVYDYGICMTCGAARVSKWSEPEPEEFLLSMVCSADDTHGC
jgi:hypothetical protein